jgi:hypothetical protein
MEIIDEFGDMSRQEWDTLRRWAKEQKDREVESMKQFEGRLRHARESSNGNLDALVRLSPERWAEPVAIVREEREIESLREQLREQQS